MARKTLYLLGILLTIIIGAILYYNYCCNCKTTAVAAASPPLTKTDTANTKDTVSTKTDTAKAIDWNALKEKINANPLVLYFGTAQAGINLTAEDNQKVSDIVKYMGHVDAATVNIVGYTDNVGKRETNMKMGQQRAESSKDYFVKDGISASKIKTSSKGPDEPAADNSTTDGKSKNRRTVVTVN